VVCGFGSFLLFFSVFWFGGFSGGRRVEVVSFVFVLNVWRESFLCCDLGLWGRGEGELGVYASMVVVEALFR
jgi:hypothetical protein